MTEILNLLGGPGSGKSVNGLLLTGTLKKSGRKAEYASEFAKDAVWDKNFETLQDQIYVFAKQNKRLYRLVNQVDYVVTDTSLLLSLTYLNDSTKKFVKDRSYWEKCFEDLIIETYNQYDNINFYCERGNWEYETIGRRQTLEESLVKDNETLAILDKFEIKYQKVKSLEEIKQHLGV